MEQNISLSVESVINPATFKIVLSNPVSDKIQYRKIVVNKKESGYQIERFTQRQVFHQNVTFQDVVPFLISVLGKDYNQLNAWDEELETNLRIAKKGKVLLSRTAVEKAPKVELEHNRQKNYILKEGSFIEPLVDMGIFTRQGTVVPSMYDKYRQINRFVEIIDDEISKIQITRPLRIIDFGCGKSYLTFILYYYFTAIKNIKVDMIGLDLKADVVSNCNKAAQKYGYETLHFELGDINGYKCDDDIDMVVTLHACDTATDYALYNAVSWNAKMIFSVPCCQHELNAQISSDNFSILTRYGIIKERTAALMTDAIRANLLECCGYRTQLIEFVDFAHTPKNILIRAIKGGENSSADTYYNEVKRLMDEFSLNPTLFRLLEERLNSK